MSRATLNAVGANGIRPSWPLTCGGGGGGGGSSISTAIPTDGRRLRTACAHLRQAHLTPARQRHSSAPVPTDAHGLHALHGHVRSGGARQTRVCLCACCERTRARTPRQLWRKHAAMACKHGSTPCARAAYPRGTNTASPPRCTNSSGRVAPLHEALAARGASFAAQECALTGGRACMCAAPAKREEPIGVLTLARCSRV